MALYSGTGYDFASQGPVDKSTRKAWRAYTGPALGITQGFIKAGLGALNFFSGGAGGAGAMAGTAMKAVGGAIGGIAPEITGMFERSANKKFGYNRNTALRTKQASAVGVTTAGIGNTIASAVLGNYGAAVTEAGQLGVGLAAGLKSQSEGGNFEEAYVRGAYSPIKAGEMLSQGSKVRTGSAVDKLNTTVATSVNENPSIDESISAGGGRGLFAGVNEDPLPTGIGNASRGGFKHGGLYRKGAVGITPEIGTESSDSIQTSNVNDGSVIIPAYMREAFLSKYGKHFPELYQTAKV